MGLARTIPAPALLAQVHQFLDCQDQFLWRKQQKALVAHARSSSPSRQADSEVNDHSAEIFAQHFESKVDRIRSSTANVPAPLITDRPVQEPLTQFKPVTSGEVVAVLKKALAKQCSSDPVPTWLVKQLSSIFAPVIANMCNVSFDQRTLPVD